MRERYKIPLEYKQKATIACWLFIRKPGHKWPIYYMLVVYKTIGPNLYVDIIKQMLEYCEANSLWKVSTIYGDFRELNFIPHSNFIVSGSWDRPHFQNIMPSNLLTFDRKIFLRYYEV